MKNPVLLCFRRDLRLTANLALEAAIESGAPVLPVFIWSPDEETPWAPGAASNWWLHHSLLAMERDLGKRGAPLVVRRGPTAEALLKLAAESGATSVYWNRRYEPDEAKLESLLREGGLATATFPGALLFEPGAIRNSSGRPFQVFTAFYKACLAMPHPPAPREAPKRILAPAETPNSVPVSELGLEPKIDWAGGLREAWQPGEAGALAQMRVFLSGAVSDYYAGRDRPDRSGTSRLSPHLHFGEISPGQIWHSSDAEAFLRQIMWREFAHQLLFHFPQTPQEPLRQEFRAFPWRFDEPTFQAWTRGKTGYPLVDAGMRELWHTGWMHNRVRMVTASFLVKHLLIPWQEGAAWFRETLVDADLANNTMGWQWVAGCGADAAPYFRIFNPVIQGEKFDPHGDYVRQWVPELGNLPSAWIHKPWQAPAPILAQLGRTYPKPIVIHEAARERALVALASIKH